MRTAQVRLVDYIQSVRDPEIKQLQTKQEECYEDISDHNFANDFKVCLIPSSELTGNDSMPRAVLILALLTT